jgi:hypothetical protein
VSENQSNGEVVKSLSRYKGEGLNIHQKIAEMKANLVVEKTGYDEKNDYMFFKADDVARDVHKIMTQYGVVTRTTIDNSAINIDSYWDKSGRNRFRVTAVVTVTFVDCDGKGAIDSQVIATGSDIGGDKATRKMMVQAFKEAAIDVFGITEGMQSMDSDAYPADEPDVAEVDDTKNNVPAVDTKALGLRIKEMIEDQELEHINAEMVTKLGREAASEVLGNVPSDRVWRKDARVLEELVSRLTNGDIPVSSESSSSE